jgi:hypothetical protein
MLSLPTLSSSPDLFELMNILADAYHAAYQTLYEAKPITCPITDTTFDAVPAPCAVVLDVSQSTDMLHVTIDGDASVMIVFYVFTSSSLAVLNCMLLEQSAGILYQYLLA